MTPPPAAASRANSSLGPINPDYLNSIGGGASRHLDSTANFDEHQQRQQYIAEHGYQNGSADLTLGRSSVGYSPLNHHYPTLYPATSSSVAAAAAANSSVQTRYNAANLYQPSASSSYAHTNASRMQYSAGGGFTHDTSANQPARSPPPSFPANSATAYNYLMLNNMATVTSWSSQNQHNPPPPQPPLLQSMAESDTLNELEDGGPDANLIDATPANDLNMRPLTDGMTVGDAKEKLIGDHHQSSFPDELHQQRPAVKLLSQNYKEASFV